MSKMKMFKNYESSAGRTSIPPTATEGEPHFITWDIDVTSPGQVRSGVWESTVGAWRTEQGNAWEFCCIIAGVSEIIEDGYPPVRVEAGDAFALQPGFKGLWRVIETTRKYWIERDYMETSPLTSAPEAT